MFKSALVLVFLISAFCVHLYTSQTLTISCPSCSQYSLLADNVTLATLDCAAGTFCNSTAGTYSAPCSAGYSCNSIYANATSSYNCSTTGRFAYSSNCRQYYYCFTNGTAFTNLVLTCPGLTYFDTITLTCTLRTTRVCGNVTYTSTLAAG